MLLLRSVGSIGGSCSWLQQVPRPDFIMRVAENSWLAARMQPIGIKSADVLLGDDLDIIHPDAAQFTASIIRCFLNVRFMFIERIHAGNAEKILSWFRKTPVTAGKIHYKAIDESFLCVFRRIHRRDETTKEAIRIAPRARQYALQVL